MEHIKRIVVSDVLAGKMDGLKRKYQHLESKIEDIEQELKRETESSFWKRPKKEVQNWIANVRSAKIKVEELVQEVSRSGFFQRLWVEGKVDSLTREVTELVELSKFERGLTLKTYDNERVALLTKTLVGKTFAENMKRILDRLMGGEDSVVGVYGMGGVGKTTLMTHIHNQLLYHPDIYVSWVTVSQNFSIQKLQHDVAKTIHLDISGEDDLRKRAAKLAESLKRREKNLLLILDDVWEHISLEDVGIRVGENVWKLVLTTRSLTVCRTLNCINPIKVEPLSEVEAWTLFTETLGNEALLSDHQIKQTAKALVRECDGLPLGIVVMGGSMRGVDDIHEWSNALEEIKGAKYRNNDMEFYDHVFLVLRYSYDKLRDQKVKECLLYCSLFPEDKLIERGMLIGYFIDENLIDERCSRQSQFEKGHTILNKLENVCLLEAQISYNGVKCVKMHDLVRDMAIKIASESPHQFWVQAGMRVQDMRYDGKWSDDLVRVSLMDNRISMIPSNASPRCPRLLTLLLCNNPFKVVPSTFFAHMKLLTVLDLSHTNIESLPASIANLEGLAALLLRRCRQLRYVPSLENLTALRRLDLSSSPIGEVPKGMEKLKNLRYLNLEECWKLDMIPVGILPELSHIEWFRSCHSIRLRGEETGCLRKLETFYGTFHHIDELASCVRSWEERAPNNYNIYVGVRNSEMGYTFYGDPERGKYVHVYKSGNAENTSVIPLSTHLLKLDRCHDLTSLSHIATMGKVIDVRSCDISYCNGMRRVICSCCSVPFLQTLESLSLKDLPMLTDLVEKNMRSSYSSPTSSVIPSNTFSSLNYLYIKRCGLKGLFTPSLLSALRSLQDLYVVNCIELVEIVGDEEATPTILCTPPNLKHLSLVGLPKLKSFCSSSIKLFDSLQTIRIRKCPKLKRVTLLWEDPHPPASLGAVEVQKEWWDSVEWKHPHTKDVLQPFLHFLPFF